MTGDSAGEHGALRRAPGMTRSYGGNIALYARTTVQLRPGQVVHRARLRAQRKALRRWPRAGRRLLAGPDPSAAKGWPDGFEPVDSRVSLAWPGLAELASGRIELLGMSRALGDPSEWEHADAPKLWRFHLHYWDWAWGLAAEPDREAARVVFGRLWQSWQAAVPFGTGDAWLPYPAALRAWSWCGQYRYLVAGREIEDRFVRDLAAHCGFLRRHLESDVGGNHLIKDLKALAGLAVFFGDERLLRRTLGRLADQVAVQVLPDGGHYERAPAYHCQVLADLMDVAGLVAAAGASPGVELTGAISRMRKWLGYVLLPDGQVPLLNDGYPVPAALLAVLRLEPSPDDVVPDDVVPDRRPQAGRTSIGPLIVLPSSGLVRAAVGDWHLLADVGAPCPDELPAHAHADTFGCLLHVRGVPLLVDTGTSTYEPGSVREYERSTAAHSTIEINGMDSTEVWGAFRAGRRARVSGMTAHATTDAVTIEAAHDGYRRLPGSPVHRRCWSLTRSGLRVRDHVTGTGRFAIALRWHLAPGTVARIKTDPSGRPWVGEVVITAAARRTGGAVNGLDAEVGIGLSASCALELEVEPAPVAAGFARVAAGPVVICRLNAELPVRVTTRWRSLPLAGASRPVTDEGKEIA